MSIFKILSLLFLPFFLVSQGKISNEYFNLQYDNVYWELMDSYDLNEHIFHAKDKTGKDVKYVSGLYSAKSKSPFGYPRVLIQVYTFKNDIDFNEIKKLFSKINVKIIEEEEKLKGYISDLGTIKSFINESNEYLTLRATVKYENYGEVEQISFIKASGKSALYIHCYDKPDSFKYSFAKFKLINESINVYK